MKLGKRYIAMWKHGDPTSDPRKDEPWISDELHREPPITAPRGGANSHCSCNDPHVIASTLEVDLDDLLGTEATDVERAMFHERMETKHAAERDRYWPALAGAAPKPAGDQVTSTKWQLRADAMYEQLPSAARGLLARASDAINPMLAGDWDALAKFCSAMVDVHQSILGAPMPCAGCGGVESICNCECGYHYCGCPCHVAMEAWALGREVPP